MSAGVINPVPEGAPLQMGVIRVEGPSVHEQRASEADEAARTYQDVYILSPGCRVTIDGVPIFGVTLISIVRGGS